MQLSLSLDPGTFMFFLSIFAIFMGLISFSSSRAVSPNIQGLREWSYAMLCLGVTFFLYFLRPYVTDFFTILLANTFLLATPTYTVIAHSKFFHQVVYKKLLMSGMVSVWMINFCVYFFSLPLNIIGLTISVSGGLLFGIAITQIIRHSNWKKDSSVWLSLTSMSILVIVMSIRLFTILFGASSNMVSSSGTTFGFYIAISFTIVATSMGFILMVNEAQKNQMIEASKRDGLTGLYTRSAFFESADKIDNLIPQESYSVLMVDIDFFKKINDTYGHAAGDVAIIQLSRLLAKHARAEDLVGRYGGEEFCILLRNSTFEKTAEFANHLVATASKEEINLPNDKKIGFTISIGYTQRKIVVEEKSLTISELLEKADQGLYQAKRTGRNQAIGNI